MKLAVLSLIGAGGLLSACAGPYYDQPPPGPLAAAPAYGVDAAEAAQGGCFRTHDIRNHTLAGDDHTLYVGIIGGDVYRISTRSSCLAGAMPSDPLMMREPPGSSLVCKPIDLDLAVSKGGMSATPCIVDSIVRLTPAEVAALPPKLRP